MQHNCPKCTMTSQENNSLFKRKGPWVSEGVKSIQCTEEYSQIDPILSREVG